MGKEATGCGSAHICTREHGGWHWEEHTYELVQPVHNEKVVEQGKGLYMGHNEGHDRHHEHAIQVHLWAQDDKHMVDEDEQDMATVNSDWAKVKEKSLEQCRMSKMKVME
jgi:hypothetical protein